MFIGIEIGGTKFQVALGAGTGHLLALHRETVALERGGPGIREQILRSIPTLLQQQQIALSQVRAIGIGFGGPVDDRSRSSITSHQVAGWDQFPLAAWLEEQLGCPVALGNDADVAGLAEATQGAGRGYNPVLYMTIGSGIGGGLIIDGKIARGTGRGAAEIGHLQIQDPEAPTERDTLEHLASGWGITRYFQRLVPGTDLQTGQAIAQAARAGNAQAARAIRRAVIAISDAIVSAITLICPGRVVIGGGVSLMGDDLIFDPLRELVAEKTFKPFAGLTEIVPASQGEEVVLHGAIELAKGLVG